MSEKAAIAMACKRELIQAAKQADENGITPDEDALGVYGAGISSLEISLVLGSDLTLFLNVSPMGEAISGRIECSGFSDKHTEVLEGQELDTIASLFEVRIHDATEKLLAARIGL